MNLLKLFFYIALFNTSITIAQNQTDLEMFIQSEDLRPSPIAVFASYKADIKNNADTILIEDEKPLIRLAFDIRENKVEESSYKRDGSLDKHSTYKYDQKANKIEYSYSQYNSSSIVSNKKESYKNTYDTQGMLIEVLKFTGSVLTGRESYNYNQQGNRIETSLYSSEDILIFQEVYKYDQQDNIIEILKFNGDENPIKIEHLQFKYDLNGIKIEESIFSNDTIVEQNKFDQQGNKIEYFGYRSDGSLDTHITRSFDESGNKLEEFNEYFTYGKEVTYKYQYDKQGNTTEYTSYDTEGNLVIHQTYSYDPQGNQTEHSEYSVADGHLTSQQRCEYDYDAYSNWIKRTCIEFVNVLGDLQPDYGLSFREIIRRDIKYY